jgi:hypothetical protein
MFTSLSNEQLTSVVGAQQASSTDADRQVVSRLQNCFLTAAGNSNIGHLRPNESAERRAGNPDWAVNFAESIFRDRNGQSYVGEVNLCR